MNIEHLTEMRQSADAERRQDAAFARQCVEWALDRNSVEFRTLGPDSLLAAAQVYATLATRRI